MKHILMINTSPRVNGNTSICLDEMAAIFKQKGLQVDRLNIGNLDVRGCIACNYCKSHGQCVFHDIVNEAAPLLAQADGVVVGSPVYYANPNGTASSFLQRLFYSTPFDKKMKVGAAVAVARRSGAVSSFDDLNKYFTINGMPVAASQYWNNAYGSKPGEVRQDGEGLQTMRTLARNMTFLIEAIGMAKETIGLPETEEHIATNFIR